MHHNPHAGTRLPGFNLFTPFIVFFSYKNASEGEGIIEPFLLSEEGWEENSDYKANTLF